MEERPEHSQMFVFLRFAAFILGLQHHLQKDYHTDRCLRNRLMSGIHIPDIQHAFRDRSPRTCHQHMNPVTKRFSMRLESSSAEAHIAQHKDNEDAKDQMAARYILDKKYGADAKGNMNRYEPTHRKKGGRRNEPGRIQGRRLRFPWIGGVKRCFVCAKQHQETISIPGTKLMLWWPK